MNSGQARRYYYLDTSGVDTNLQLYALSQAKRQWADLEDDLLKNSEDVPHFHERCVFLICTIGLSVSQLLGQNNPAPTDRVPSPKQIFNAVVKENNLDLSLKAQFESFIDVYDQCRHFGLTNGDRRHWEVSQITLSKASELYHFGLLVWSVLIGVYRKNPDNYLEGFDLSTFEEDL